MPWEMPRLLEENKQPSPWHPLAHNDRNIKQFLTKPSGGLHTIPFELDFFENKKGNNQMRA